MRREGRKIGLRGVSASYIVVYDGFYHVKAEDVLAWNLHIVVLWVCTPENDEGGVGGVSPEIFYHTIIFKQYNVYLPPKDAVKVGNAAYGHESAIVYDGGHTVAGDTYHSAVAREVWEGDAAYDAVVGEE